MNCEDCIRTICANAFADCVSNQRMDICLYHLPVQLLDHLKVEKNSRDSDSLIRIDAVEKNAAGSKILIMWEQLLQAFEETCMDTHAFTSFLEQGQKPCATTMISLFFRKRTMTADWRLWRK